MHRDTHGQCQEAQHGQGVAQVPLPGRCSVPQLCGGDMRGLRGSTNPSSGQQIDGCQYRGLQFPSSQGISALSAKLEGAGSLPGFSPSFRLLLRMAKSCSCSSSTFQLSQQEALPVREEMLRGWRAEGPSSTLRAPPPVGIHAGHPPEQILRDTAASSSLVQLNCSSRSSRSWGWVRSP